MNYEMIYAHSDNDIPGSLPLRANTDEQAINEVRAFVEDGFRNGTWGSIEFADGSGYICHNRYGRAEGCQLPAFVQ